MSWFFFSDFSRGHFPLFVYLVKQCEFSWVVPPKREIGGCLDFSAIFPAVCPLTDLLFWRHSRGYFSIFPSFGKKMWLFSSFSTIIPRNPGIDFSAFFQQSSNLFYDFSSSPPFDKSCQQIPVILLEFSHQNAPENPGIAWIFQRVSSSHWIFPVISFLGNFPVVFKRFPVECWFFGGVGWGLPVIFESFSLEFPVIFRFFAWVFQSPFQGFQPDIFQSFQSFQCQFSSVSSVFERDLWNFQ